MHALVKKLVERGPVLTDGAWGTQLQARGLAPGEMPDLWNLAHPQKVVEVARAYIKAGSQVILTNTFGSNRIRLRGTEGESKVAELNEAGVQLSRQAAGNRVTVFASMGPTGKLPSAGEISAEELAEAFAEQAEALKRAGADGIVVETMSDLDEARIAVDAARKTGLPVVASMVFDSGKDKDRTMTGVTPEAAAVALRQAGADVIGANCGQGIAGFAGICARLKAAAEGSPIWIKPNAGLPEMRAGKCYYDMTPKEFASHVPALIEAGASFIGGCCGTTPQFIRAMRLELISPSSGESARA
ncbi:MAG TPA: methionine synthase [Verrucomicrobia bacterium]|nr:methionine synthase [Verrucomicrobiota bacterium]HOP98779.1 homocysteine S-methyltransferase family protein [Verrucomicrobiota bacterium]